MWFVVSAVWGLWSAQGALVLEATLLLCWPIPRVVTGGCASITACDSVDMIGNLLVPLKLLSVRVLFFELAALTVKPAVVSHTSCGREALPTLVL